MKSMKSTVQRTDEDELLKIMGDKSPVGVCIIQDGKFCYVNSNFPIATGYTADELVDSDPLELIVPEDREMVRENEIKMLKGELIPPYQFRVIHKDGSIRWVMEAVRSVQYHGRRAVLGNYMEVTERKQAEDALKESGEKYRELADSITDIFFAMDKHLRYIYWNKTSGILTGIRAEDAIGKSLREIFPDTPGMRKAEKVYRNVLKTQQPQTFVNDMDIDGRHYIFEISAYPSRGGISVFVKDITERKQAEEKLEKSEQKYRLLFETSLDCIAQIDREGRFLAANPASARSLGVPLEELIGKTFSEVMPQEVAQHRLETVRKVLDEWQPQIVEDERAGRYFHHIDIPTKISDQKEAVQVITRDITERKQAEEALRRSEERYRTTLEEMEDSYFEVDLAGNLTFVNNSVCRDLGYSMEELIGMSYKGFTVEDDIESVFRVFNEVYRTGVPNKGFPWRTSRKDGSQGFAETSISPLRNDKGEIIGFRGVGRDITERKQAEEKLRQSKENYRALFDSSVIGALVVDAETMKVVRGNQAAVKMFGFSSAEEGAGVNPLDFISPEEREKALELIMKGLFEQDLRRAFDFPVVTKDGRTIWISATGARIMHKGRLAGLLSFTDITERKQAEEALRQSEERYRTILEEMEEGYYEVDIAGNFTFVNDAMSCMLGYSRDELIGMNYKIYMPQEDVKAIFQAYNRVYRTGEPLKGFPMVEVRKDGTQLLVEDSLFLMRNDKGEVIGFRGVSRDVTQRKQAEEKLRQSEENYRVLFDSTVIGTIVLDAETMEIVMVNQAALKMFGFSSEGEAFKAKPFDFLLPEDKEKYLGITKSAVFDQNSHEGYQLRAVTKDGREIWINTMATMIMHRGKLAALISFTDITEQKRQNEQLMLADRLASIGELVAGTAHEINNPLTSIIGFSQLLMEREVPDDIREDLKLIYNEAQRAASVTKNLLTFARKHAHMKQRSQINNIIEDVLKLCVYEHKVNAIEVESQLDPDLPEIMTDYFQMQQVFMNIISNAEYFMTEAHNKGTLTITTKKQDNTVMISIADDGPGIPPENLKRIFDPFFTTKETSKGTGLGLSICHGIVTEHGGQIYVRSQLGKGTTIFVELPISGS